MKSKNEIRFLTDAMLGKLTRHLRIFGIDTIYADDLENIYGDYPIPDNFLIEYAKKTDRILLTRDLPLYQRFRHKSIYLTGMNVIDYLKQLKSKFHFNYKIMLKNSRCSSCNTLLSLVKNKEDIKERVKPQTYERYSKFYECQNSKCKKIFWNGSHIDDINSKIRNL